MTAPPKNGVLKLGIAERIALFSALPQEGSFDTLRVVRKLQEDLALSEAENKASNFHKEDLPEPRWLWDKNVVKEFTFSPAARDLLRKGLETISAKGQAKDLHLAMYEQLGEPSTNGDGKTKHAS